MLKNNKFIKIALFVVLFSLVLCLTACGNSGKSSPKEVVDLYFDSLKTGDVDGAVSCFTPTIQEKMKDTYIYSPEYKDKLKKAYKNCTFKVDNVTYTDKEYEHAEVHVTVSGNSSMPSEDTLEVVKYKGEWYLDSSF